MKRDSPSHQFLKKIMALAFLPSHKIEKVVECIERCIEREEMSETAKKFLGWNRKYWINRWDSQAFSVFQRKVRTNNDLEGFLFVCHHKAG